MNRRIIAPSIHLFAFNLQKSDIINFHDKNPKIDKDWLWQTCNEIISTVLQKNDFNFTDYLDLEKQPNSLYVILSNINYMNSLPKLKYNNFYIADSIPLDSTVTFNNLPLRIQGFSYPVRIYNSFGLWLNLGRPKQENDHITDEVDISFFRQLNPNNVFLSADKQDFSGQRILITAWLTEADTHKTKQELKEYADECLKAFLPENSDIPPFNRDGELFGSPIFQYGLERDLPSSGNILIWFFRGNEAHRKFYYSRFQLFHLFFYRAHVIKCFQDIIKQFQFLERLHTVLVQDIENLQMHGKNKTLSQKDLDEFQSQLKRLPIQSQQYEEFKANIQICKNDIDDKIRKYKINIDKIKNQFPEENICFLESLSNDFWPYYQEQIEANLLYFEHGSRLISNAISSIRGQVAIEQTELANKRIENQEQSDRKLQQIITTVGIGFSIGGMMSQIIASDDFAPFFIKTFFGGEGISQPSSQPSYKDSYFVTATIFCIIVSIIFAFVANQMIDSFPASIRKSKRWMRRLLGNKRNK
jgi:hypothetical protein